MARSARKVSPSGYYHVMQRGIGKQLLFENDYDYEKYLKKLFELKSFVEFELSAYCLMNNHVHLLIKVDGLDKLSRLMQMIGTSYANYYNKKYEHCGYVFQNRFHSEVIDSERYLLSCLNYIHNNPLKAGICAREDYPWSSYNAYITGNDLVDTAAIMNILGSTNEFVEFSKSNDHRYKMKFADVENDRSFINLGLEIISCCLDMECTSGLIVNQLNKDMRNSIIYNLKKSRFSNKEIELLTGVSQGVIKRV